MWSQWQYLKGPEYEESIIKIKKKAPAGAFFIEAQGDGLVSVSTHNAQECEQVGEDVIDI
jgi:hypothetical protein